MVCLLPVLAIASPVRVWRVRLPYGAKARTWLALIAASVAGRQIGYPEGVPPEFLWAAIDGMAALAVLWPPKARVYRSEGQRAIGLLFIAMMLSSIGFHIAGLMQPGPRDFTGIVYFLALMGWLQWAFLLSWGVGDALERAFRRDWSASDQAVDRIGAAR